MRATPPPQTSTVHRPRAPPRAVDPGRRRLDLDPAHRRQGPRQKTSGTQDEQAHGPLTHVASSRWGSTVPALMPFGTTSGHSTTELLDVHHFSTQNPSHPGISDTTPPLSAPTSPPPPALKPSSALWNKRQRRPPRTQAAARHQDPAPPLVAPPEPNALHPHLLHILVVARTRGWCWPGSMLQTWRGGGWLTPRTASHQSNYTASPHSGILKKIHVGLACLTSCSNEPMQASSRRCSVHKSMRDVKAAVASYVSLLCCPSVAVQQQQKTAAILHGKL